MLCCTCHVLCGLYICFGYQYIQIEVNAETASRPPVVISFRVRCHCGRVIRGKPRAHGLKRASRMQSYCVIGFRLRLPSSCASVY